MHITQKQDFKFSGVCICSCEKGDCEFRRVMFSRKGKYLKRPLPVCEWDGSCSLKVVGNMRSAFRRFGIDRENLKRF